MTHTYSVFNEQYYFHFHKIYIQPIVYKWVVYYTYTISTKLCNCAILLPSSQQMPSKIVLVNVPVAIWSLCQNIKLGKVAIFWLGRYFKYILKCEVFCINYVFKLGMKKSRGVISSDNSLHNFFSQCYHTKCWFLSIVRDFYSKSIPSFFI